MEVEEYLRRLHEGANKVRDTLGEAKIAVILGSGLGNFASQIDNAIDLPFDQVPGMPLPTVHGHAGKFVGGKVGGNSVYCMAGRLHRYEGYAPFQILFSVRMFHLLGVEVYIATNAAGGCGETMREGDLMCLSSHVNFGGFGPMDDVVCGDEWPCVERRATEPYSERLRRLALRVSEEVNVRMHEGVYWMNSGPTYETPSEIRAGKHFGSSAFGMSTVPECLVAKALGMEVCAFSLVTNLAAGMTGKELSHEEVAETAGRAAKFFEHFMRVFISQIPEPPPPTQPPISPLPTSLTLPLSLPQPVSLARGADAIRQATASVAISLSLNVQDGRTFHQPAASSSPPPSSPSLSPELLVLYFSERGQIQQIVNFLGAVDAKYMQIRDIPHFPTSSLSARHGVLFSIPFTPLSSVSSPSSPSSSPSSCARVVGIILSEMGLDAAEACFLTQILSTLQLFSTSIHLFPSSPLSELSNNEEGKGEGKGEAQITDRFSSDLLLSEKRKRVADGASEYVVINDLFPFLSLVPLPHGGRISKEDTSFLHQQSLFRSAPLNPYNSSKYLSVLLRKEPAEECACAFALGPLYPSTSEISIFEKVGCGRVSVTNPSFLFSLQSSGLRSHALSPSSSDDVHFSESLLSLSQQLISAVSRSLGGDAATKEQTITDGIEVDYLTLSPPLLADFSTAIHGEVQLTQNFPSPFPAVRRKRIQEVAGEIKASMPSQMSVSVGVVLDWHVSDGEKCFPFENFNVKKWIPFSNLIEGAENVSGELGLAKVTGGYVFLLRSRFLYEGHSTAAVAAPVRLLYELGVKVVLGVPELFACNTELSTGDIVIVSDQVNLSQRNACFGPNDDTWGPRFLDLQQIYRNDAFDMVLPEINDEVRRITAGFVVGPLFPSKTMTSYFVQSGVNAVCTSVVPEMVIAHHMGVRALMIGHVTGRTFDTQEDVTLSNAHLLRLRVLVVRLCKFLISKYSESAGGNGEGMED